MAGVGPSWFAVDEVFEGHGGWYVGSRDGFSIGPYDTVDQAEAQARDLCRQFSAAGGDVGEMLHVVRRTLESRQHNGARRASYGRMSPGRAGEPPTLGYRSPRLYAQYGKWYFVTREGIDVGPYASREVAEQAQHRLVAQLKRCDNDRERRLAIFEFMTAATDGTA